MSGAPAAPAVPTTENCRFCWMCRHVCPVGHVMHRETLTPHGWALTIESVKRGQLAWDAETTGLLYACADCGLCRAHCATDQPLPDAIAAARADVVRAGGAPTSVYGVETRMRESLSRSHSRGQTGDVALFPGEAGDGVVAAASRLLAAAGVNVVRVGAGRSSGSVAASLGLVDAAGEAGRALMAEVAASGATEVLVLTPGDRWAFEYVYPVRLGLAWPGHVRVREVVEVLAAAQAGGRLAFQPPPARAAYVYHEPCHRARTARRSTDARALLDAALGPSSARPMFWREDRAHPCGATGGLEITHPDIAARLAEARLADARSAGATSIVTEDSGCAGHLHRHASGVAVENLYEQLAVRAQ